MSRYIDNITMSRRWIAERPDTVRGAPVTLNGYTSLAHDSFIRFEGPKKCVLIPCLFLYYPPPDLTVHEGAHVTCLECLSL